MKTKKHSIPRAILPAQSSLSSSSEDLSLIGMKRSLITLSPKSQSKARNYQPIGKKPLNGYQKHGQFDKDIITDKMAEAPALPANPDGSPLRYSNLPSELSAEQRAAIRDRLRRSLRLKMILKSGKLPENPSLPEMELWLQRTNELSFLDHFNPQYTNQNQTQQQRPKPQNTASCRRSEEIFDNMAHNVMMPNNMPVSPTSLLPLIDRISRLNDPADNKDGNSNYFLASPQESLLGQNHQEQPHRSLLSPDAFLNDSPILGPPSPSAILHDLCQQYTDSIRP